jgi:hypothetical protein
MSKGSGKKIIGPIPEHIRRLMPKEDRQDLGERAITNEEALCRADIKAEKELQKNIENLLRLYGIESNRSRMDRKKTDRVGWPDFVFGIKGTNSKYAIACAVEIKLPGGKLQPEQEQILGKLKRDGWAVATIHSVKEMIDWIKLLRDEN